MKKLLVNGGGHSEIPLIKASKELGFYVITTGYDEFGLGHIYSDEYIKADFSNKDEIVNLVQKNSIDYIIPSCNDFSILTASYVSEKLPIGNFDSYQTTKILHHKDLFRAFAMKYNISVPQAISLTSFQDIDKLKYPLMVKAIDLSGGKGIQKVDNKIDLQKAFEESLSLSREDSVIVEEFIDGTHHSASILIQNKKIIFDFFADEYFYLNQYLVAGASSNYIISNKCKNKLFEDTNRLIELLNLVDGILHIQFIIRNNTPYILEITRRSPGDLYLELVNLSSGINYAKKIIQLYCGLDVQIDSKEEKLITRHCIMSDKIGKLKNIIYDDNIKDNIIDEFMWWREGDEIKDMMTHKFGIVFLKYNSIEEMREKTDNIHKLIKVVVY